MATGYTAKLVEEGQTFGEFALTCARAFGALIEMRDQPLSAKIPDTLGARKTTSQDWYRKQLEEYTRKVEQLESWTQEQRLDYGESEKKRFINSSQDSLLKVRQQNAKVNAMLRQVEAWEPPTKDHYELKKFMLEQLRITLTDEHCYKERLKEAWDTSPQKYFDWELRSAREMVKSYKEDLEKEDNSYKDANEWLQALRESLRSHQSESAPRPKLVDETQHESELRSNNPLTEDEVDWLSSIADTQADPYKTMAMDAITWNRRETYEHLRKVLSK